jgi:hypothetical protein
MNPPPLPPYVTLDQVQKRLRQIFPAGHEYFSWCTRDIAAKTVCSLLYVGAVDGAHRYFAPKQAYRMTRDQAALSSDAARIDYGIQSMKNGFSPRGKTWYADNSREAIRDETLRQALAPVGALIVDRAVPTSSGKGRYALASDFAALFDPALEGPALDAAIESWRKAHLSKGALAAVKLAAAGATKSKHGMTVNFPSGETRKLTAGDSSVITKAIVEDFAPRFLTNPAVIWISEGGKKVVQRDDETAESIGLKIDPARNLPDVILADVAAGDVFLVFIEVVATDGPISTKRRLDLLKYATEAGLDEDKVAFVTAYMHRNAAMKKNLPALAWNSFVWLASEPENLIALAGQASSDSLRTLLRK